MSKWTINNSGLKIETASEAKYNIDKQNTFRKEEES